MSGSCTRLSASSESDSTSESVRARTVPSLSRMWPSRWGGFRWRSDASSAAFELGLQGLVETGRYRVRVARWWGSSRPLAGVPALRCGRIRSSRSGRGWSMASNETRSAIEVVQAHMEAEDRQDLDATLATFTEDCYYSVPGLGIELRGQGRDPALVRGPVRRDPRLPQQRGALLGGRRTDLLRRLHGGHAPRHVAWLGAHRPQVQEPDARPDPDRAPTG